MTLLVIFDVNLRKIKKKKNIQFATVSAPTLKRNHSIMGE